ncbi:hypothetical protein MYSTI_06314 [Myxococcus stipitatus DSM 14675]|uniref:MJ0042 family finger-like domain-containing protein n=1 Tax=Myxococcus stipitatus (strain DSM 14675 / JCM 12634 / Mx s8) TaxID=1278073 RepID=L7UJ56_MYXSD|nr:GYF domain-containing protein [Myxococcus stipitatus]AGC47587.1 hypothetical protein MYSTI_06314 [Myxococcus stipitatus DSM 14675]
MNFTCDNCQKRYSIADEKVRGKTVKVRCKNCQNVITVEGPAEEESTRVVSLADVERLRAQERSLAEPAASAAPAPVASSPALDKAPPAALQTPWDDEPTRAAPLRATGSPWFVMVRNKQEGPLDEGALRELVATGTISGRSFFWQQGMADWKRGADVPELAGLFAPVAAPEPPPPPPPVAEAPPARAAKSAPTRREPEPQPSYQEPEQRFTPEPEPEPQLPPEEEPEAPAQRQWVPEEDPDTTYFGEPDPRNQPQPSSRRGGAPAASAAPLNELFSDLDLPEKGESDDGVPQEDPLAAARDDEEDEAPPARTSSTRNAAKSGKSKKVSTKSGGGSKGKVVALVLLLLIVVPLGAAFALDATGIMPLRVKALDASGQVVERSIFSGAGMAALSDQMAGKPAPVPTAKPPPAPAPDEQPAAPKQPVAGEGEAGAPSEEKAAPAAEGETEKPAPAEGTEKQAAAPQAGEGAEAPAGEDEVGGPSDEEVERVVNEKQAAFRDCVAQELRRNPSFKGGNVTLTATVGTSGAVKATTFSRKDLNAAANPVGTCIRDQAKGMVFSSFKGEDVDLEIPIALSAR